MRQSCCFDRKHSSSRIILRQRANATEDFDVDSLRVVHVLISHMIDGRNNLSRDRIQRMKATSKTATPVVFCFETFLSST